MKKTISIFLSLLYLEVIYHVFTFETYDYKSIIFLLIFTVFNTIFIDIITSLFKEKTNKVIFLLILLSLTIIFEAQFIDYKFYGNVISIYSITHGTQVLEYWKMILTIILENIIPFILLFIPLILYIIFNKRIKTINVSYKTNIIKILSFICIYLISILTLNIDKTDIYSAYNLYYYKHVPNQMVQEFGIITSMRIDLKRTLTNFKESESLVLTDNVNTNDKIEYNKIDIDFDALIEEEDNEDVKLIHEYMNNASATNKNDYTGYFEGKNLIAIVAEAFSPIAVSETLTPTLYKLVNTGFNFTNFYTPVYNVSTSDGEYVTLTSLLPKESVWSFSKSSNNYLPYNYAEVFKNLGYTARAYHDGTYKYYNRHKSHPNLGYTYTACGNGLNIKCKSWPQSDIEMIDATVEDYINDEQFLTYYMTISGHLEYNFYGNNIAYKNKSYVKDLEYSDAVKAYIACQIELDKALENLLSYLEEAGKLDDTVIVLSADHYPYGLTTSQMKEVMDIEDEKFDIHKNNLIIWNNQMTEPVVVDKIGESLDILPTVLNLFGIEFDSRLLMGTDLLSDNDGIVILNDRSWITEKGKYNASTKTFTGDADEEYINKINNIVNNKYTISKKILETDYYTYVLGGENAS